MSLHVIFADLRQQLVVPSLDAARAAVIERFPQAWFGPRKARARQVVQRIWGSLLDAEKDQRSVARLERELTETEIEADRIAQHLERFGRLHRAPSGNVMHDDFRCWWEPTEGGARVLDCHGQVLLSGRTPEELRAFLNEAEWDVQRLGSEVTGG
jgi:hypothetical protein